jgi:hypothetical protein
MGAIKDEGMALKNRQTISVKLISNLQWWAL